MIELPKKQNKRHCDTPTGICKCHQRPVVQNFISLTLSLSPQFVNYISTSKANTLLFLLIKSENPLILTFFFNKK